MRVCVMIHSLTQSDPGTYRMQARLPCLIVLFRLSPYNLGFFFHALSLSLSLSLFDCARTQLDRTHCAAQRTGCAAADARGLCAEAEALTPQPLERFRGERADKQIIEQLRSGGTLGTPLVPLRLPRIASLSMAF